MSPVVVEGSAGVDLDEQESGLDPAGFEEGDRVRLARPFWGEPDPETGGTLTWSPELEYGGGEATYPAGSEGTVLFPDGASAEFIKDMQADSKYLVAMDDGRQLYSGGILPDVGGTSLERIPGTYQVARQNGMVRIRPKFNDGDRVRLIESFVSSDGSRFDSGWEGVIWPVRVTMVECWRTGNYPVSLDDDPFGADRGVIRVPAGMLKLVSEREAR